jgi:hypothetical protein
MDGKSKWAIRIVLAFGFALTLGLAAAQAGDVQQPPPAAQSTSVADTPGDPSDDIGAIGAVGSRKWAVVNSAGALVRGVGAVSASSLGTGTYQVTFNSDMSGCAYIATAGDTGAGAVSGPITATVATRAGNNNALFIQTFDQSTGSLSNQPFHVITFCKSKDRWAVIGSDGSIARRGSPVVSAAHLGTGNYEVIFSRPVAKCSFTGAIGTTGAGSISNPGTLTVAGRAGNKNGVFVRIVDRLGNSLDSSFHLGVTCGKASLMAVLEANGALARSHNVVSVAKLSGTNGGTYEVIFNRTVSGCAYIASIGPTTNGGSIGPPPVVITTATRAGNSNGVFLFLHQANGSTIDEPFHLAVNC